MFKRRSIVFLVGVKYLKQLKLKKALPQYHAGVADVIAHDAVTSSFFPSQPCPLQTGGGCRVGEEKMLVQQVQLKVKYEFPSRLCLKTTSDGHFVTTRAANF